MKRLGAAPVSRADVGAERDQLLRALLVDRPRGGMQRGLARIEVMPDLFEVVRLGSPSARTRLERSNRQRRRGGKQFRCTIGISPRTIACTSDKSAKSDCVDRHGFLVAILC